MTLKQALKASVLAILMGLSSPLMVAYAPSKWYDVLEKGHSNMPVIQHIQSKRVTT